MPAAAVAFALAALSFVPLTALMIALVTLFGPWKGFGVAWVGATISAVLGHTAGGFPWHGTIRELAGRRWDELEQLLTRNNFRTTIALRLVPIAPFTLVNLAAGSVRSGGWISFSAL